MKALNTVNVIEMNVESSSTSVLGLAAFPDDPEGNAAAEVRFTRLALDNGAKVANVDSHLEDGYFETGTYWLGLVHSLAPQTV